jgi:hypothetical protein
LSDLDAISNTFSLSPAVPVGRGTRDPEKRRSRDVEKSMNKTKK